MLRRLLIAFALAYISLTPQPASAVVTIVVWSHDQDESFPHISFALKGPPNAGGAENDDNYGFTGKAVTPAILLGRVADTVEVNKSGYMRRSDARLSLVLSDAQLGDSQALIAEWTTNNCCNLNKRNCVHFVAEAERRAGLTASDLPKLMKTPTSFLTAVEEANVGRIALLNLDGKTYFTAYGKLGSKIRNVPPAPMLGGGCEGAVATGRRPSPPPRCGLSMVPP